jgi:ribosome-binding protein aMBF1 (putative translation factor)
MEHQDWKAVVLRSNQANQAKKAASSSYQANSGIKVVDKENDEIEIVRVDKELAKQIREARVAKNLTQEQLARSLSISVDIVKTYENATAQRNGPLISKFKKFLNISK